MFSDYSSDVVSFESTPDNKRVVNEASCQTSSSKIEDKESQAKVSQSIQVQTDRASLTTQTPKYDENRLAEFLNRIYPELIDELNSSDFSYFNDNETGDDDFSVSRLHAIEIEDWKGKKVSSLSWSCTGMTLAISHCELNHENWCTHDGSISLYNTSKPDFSKLPPNYKLSTVSCVTSVLFHPWEPSVLAAGLYSGEVLVWDLVHDEQQQIKHKKKENAEFEVHTDTITSLAWINDQNGPLLVSAGRDGRIILWKISFSNQMLQIHKRLFILMEHMLLKNNLIGDGLEVTSINFWSDVENEFVISVDGGGILHCSIRASRPIPSLPGFEDPVVMKYERHRGIVTSVNCSPRSKLFASCGSEGEIHVYQIREPIVLHTIYVDNPLLGVEWTDAHNIVACWGMGSSIECYNVNSEEKINYYTLQNEVSNVITSAKLNRQRKGIIAVGTENGSVSIWQLPKNMGS